MTGMADIGVLDVEKIRRARAGLLRVCEPPAAGVHAMVATLGPIAAWEQVKHGSGWAAAGAVRGEVAARTDGASPAEMEGQIDADLAVAKAAGARLVIPEDTEWPADAMASFPIAHARKVNGSTAPLALYVRGATLGGLPHSGVTIVGSRASTSYGQRVAADLAIGLVEKGFSIISGAAFGIDTAAHRGALVGTRGRSTVAVLACGIDRFYPVANRGLIEAIGESGAVVSEYPPGTSPARHRFLVRNRLIAALGAGTVVVEAGRRSGTLSTASAAGQLGRVVMAIPGPVTSALSVGCHLLLADRDAMLVTDHRDVLRVLQPEETSQMALPGMWDSGHPTDGLDADSSRVFDSLSTRIYRSVSELARDSGVPAPRVISALAVLDLHGLAVGGTSGWRQSVAKASKV